MYIIINWCTLHVCEDWVNPANAPLCTNNVTHVRFNLSTSQYSDWHTGVVILEVIMQHMINERYKINFI